MNNDKIAYYSLLLVVITLPIFAKLTPIAIVLFVIITIFNAIKNKQFILVNKTITFVGLAFFLTHIISVLYSDNKNIAWFDIEVKLSLFIFPLVFIVKNEFIEKNKKYILIMFAISTLLASIYMLFTSFLNYTEIGIKSFEYTNLSKYMHPTYISIYISFSFFILLDYLINSNKKIENYLLIIPLLIFALMVFLLQSKAGYIAFVIAIMYYAYFFMSKSKSIILKVLVPVVIVSIVVIAYNNSYRLQDMVGVVKQIVLTGDSKNSTTGIRFEIWKATTEIISDNVMLGVGAGDIKPELNVKYNENIEYLGLAKDGNLNVHNQYLETFLGQGLIGIVLLVILLLLALIKAIKFKDKVYVVFVILILVNFFPESMLNKQAGVVFFALFFYLLSNTQSKNKLV